MVISTLPYSQPFKGRFLKHNCIAYRYFEAFYREHLNHHLSSILFLKTWLFIDGIFRVIKEISKIPSVKAFDSYFYIRNDNLKRWSNQYQYFCPEDVFK